MRKISHLVRAVNILADKCNATFVTIHYPESWLSGLHTRAHGTTRGDLENLGIEMGSADGSSECIVKVAVHSSRGAALLSSHHSLYQYWTILHYPPRVVKLNFLGAVGTDCCRLIGRCGQLYRPIQRQCRCRVLVVPQRRAGTPYITLC
jgi:hypothetical protein